MKKPYRKPRPLKKADREVLDSLTIGSESGHKGDIQEILENIRREIVQDRNERRLDRQNPWKDGLEGNPAQEPWGLSMFPPEPGWRVRLQKEIDSLREELKKQSLVQRGNALCIWIAIALLCVAILVLNYTR